MTREPETRFRRALRDTPGLSEAKGRRTVQSVIGAIFAVGVLVLVGSPSAALDQVLAYVGTALGGVLLVNVVEFVWHYLEAPYALIREELAHLRAEVAALPTTATAAPPPKPRVNVRGSLLLHIQRAQALVGQTMVTVPETLAWTETTAQFLSEHIGPTESEDFLAATSESGRRGIEARLAYLMILAEQRPGQQS